VNLLDYVPNDAAIVALVLEAGSPTNLEVYHATTPPRRDA
jgi:hypothetical protein